ncbi:deoxyguanosinetriphosphate triphosphohydrolase family protein [Nocardioides ganghwensis]|uniref:deoxyguanosinetriphosphate triphosphohydrolase family protein n=1 Tax=Nocardioides ganghwensis TaxID=252230 RepID=UPI0013EB609F|nr:dNTP triphosphohydrolase [Nocardioides ganghwensis]MBD3948154.1 dNTP triphosphohydrolase [Nocardioides ganghwensis]
MPAESQVVRVVPPAPHTRDERLHKQTETSPSDPRGPARHDRDRIYYSAGFRRLAGVTQVFTPDPSGFLTHNRLTHSLKVAQVGRSLAEVLLARSDLHEVLESLGGLDAEVAEAAGLAHDVGHPPFGHIGEAVLDRYAREHLSLPEGYEGNAQTFRIVARVEPRSRKPNGLDLTAATRAAVLKYPWLRAGSVPAAEADVLTHLRWKKFGVYEEDREAYESARSWVPLPENVQSVEAAAMDIADDITYALHDLEDFHESGLLDSTAAREALTTWKQSFAGRDPQDPGPLVENPFERLRAKLAKEYAVRFDAEAFEDAVTSVGAHLLQLQSESVGTRRATANTRRFVSQLITDFVGAVQVQDQPTWDQPPLMLENQHWHQVQLLKEITQQFVIQRPDLAVIQRGQQALLRGLLDDLVTWCEDAKDKRRLPGVLRESYGEYGNRGLLDYVSGLSDLQAVALHRALRGDGRHTLATSFTH